MERHEYEYDKLIVGGSLASLIYAYHESIPIVWLEPAKLYFFDKTKDGLSKKMIWEKMAFLLSLSGLAPFSDKAKLLREEDGILKVYGKEPYFIRIRAKKIIYYDKDLVEKEDTIFQVIDWVSVRNGSIHPHERFDTEDCFVKQVLFYKSERIKGNHKKKDLIAFSYLTRSQINNLDYSQNYVRLKVVELMKQAGIKGSGNGFFAGKKRYLSVKVEPIDREYRILDSEREEHLISKYNKKTPAHEQTAMWEDLLGSPYE